MDNTDLLSFLTEDALYPASREPADFNEAVTVAQENLELAVADLADLYEALVVMEAHAHHDGNEELAEACFDQQQGTLASIRELVLTFDDGTYAQALADA
jgi:hypothetical protein